jgi:hypothetical protein
MLGLLGMSFAEEDPKISIFSIRAEYTVMSKEIKIAVGKYPNEHDVRRSLRLHNCLIFCSFT